MGISHHSSFPFLGRNESVAQHCGASAEQEGAEGKAQHKDSCPPARQERGQVRGRCTAGHQPRTHLRGLWPAPPAEEAGTAEPLPSWSLLLCTPGAGTTVGAHTAGSLGSLAKETLLPQVTPILSSGITFTVSLSKPAEAEL